MEEGLSKTKRRVYLGILTAIFIVAAPLLGLYASGYRLSGDFTLIKTGGIHVSVPRAGASFYLNSRFQGTGSIFQKGFFVQDLTPGIYTVRIEQEGYHLWQKQLEVYPTVISEARALLLSKDPQITPIHAFIDPVTGKATSSPLGVPRQMNPRYVEILEIFRDTELVLLESATSSILYKGATTTVRAEGGIGLWSDSEGVHTWWLEEEDESPYFFCISEKECRRELLVYQGQREISHVDFLPDDNQFVILEREDGVYITELDIRPLQNTLPLSWMNTHRT